MPESIVPQNASDGTFPRDLSLAIDETVAMLDIASPSPFRQMLLWRRVNLESIAFSIRPSIGPAHERCDPETWNVIRAAILKRDDWKCQGCGATHDYRVHHIIPVESGGSDDPRNLITLCKSCHERIHPWLEAKDASRSRLAAPVALSRG